MVSGKVKSWEAVRSCLALPVSSPFLLRPDSIHVHTYKVPHMDAIIVSIKTSDAIKLLRLLKHAADMEDEDRFAEHFYTALEL